MRQMGQYWLCLCFLPYCVGIDIIDSHGTLFHSDNSPVLRGRAMRGTVARKVSDTFCLEYIGYALKIGFGSVFAKPLPLLQYLN